MVLTYPDGEVKLDLALRDERRVSGMHWKSDEAFVFEVLRPPKSTYVGGCGATAWGGDAYEVWGFDVKSGRYDPLSSGRVADMLADDADAFLLEGAVVSRLICSTARSRDGRMSERVAGHAQVVEDEAGLRCSRRMAAATHSSVCARTTPTAKRRSLVVFTGPCPVRIRQRSSSKALSRTLCRASTAQWPRFSSRMRLVSAVSGEWLLTP